MPDLDSKLDRTLDGHAIGCLRVRLGEQPTTVSGQAEDGLGGKLHRLGELLTRARNALAPSLRSSAEVRQQAAWPEWSDRQRHR